MANVGDIVKLVLEGAEVDAEVVKTYEDVDQKYVDVKDVRSGVLYQTVSPKAEGSIRYFEPVSKAEQKEVRKDLEEDEKKTEPVKVPGVDPSGPRTTK